MNYFRFYVGDYLKDTSRLSILEHGAYAVMLLHYYAEEAPLPLDRAELYRMARAMMPDECKAVDKVLHLFFVKEADGWHNKRADSELETATGMIERARENGQKGGRPKTKKESDVITSDKSGPVIVVDTEKLTEILSGAESQSEPKNNHPPTTNHQPPITNHQPPTEKTAGDASQAGGFLQPSDPAEQPRLAKVNRKAEPNAASERKLAKAKAEPVSSAAWESYSQAYLLRYKAVPVRNASVNALLAQLVKRLGTEEAPQVAAFYVSHSQALYVKAKHPVNLLVRDCEGLRTEWITGNRVTSTQAQHADRQQHTGDVFSKLIAESEQQRQLPDWDSPDTLSLMAMEKGIDQKAGEPYGTWRLRIIAAHPPEYREHLNARELETIERIESGDL